MDQLVSFEDAIKESGFLGPYDRTLLLGNGFSIAQGGERFAYQNLLEKSNLRRDSPIRKVFEVLKTSDFEAVIRALEHASVIALAYDNKVLASQLSADAIVVRGALVSAVHTVHPGVHFDIPREQCMACAKFLNNFSKLFTTNYDLLLYWVIVQYATGFTDGFGQSEEIDSFRSFSVRSSLKTYYLHGALHLFVNAQNET